MVMGENVRFKALVGLTSLAADEKATESNSYKGHWFARDKWPAPSEDTGLLLIPLCGGANEPGCLLVVLLCSAEFC